MSIKKGKKSVNNFNFTWDVSSTPKAKAFVARKKQQASTLKPSKEQSDKSEAPKQTTNTTKLSDVFKFSSTTTKTKTLVVRKNQPLTTKEQDKPNETFKTSESGHIKRKNKKDKLLAKQSQPETELIAEQPDSKSSTSASQPNFNLFNVRPKQIYVNTSAGKSVSEKVFVSSSSFDNLGIHPHIVSNLVKHGFKKPTNVQTKTIPVVLSGKNTLVRSQTGSGKTIAYAVPIIDALQSIQPRLKRTDGIQAIVVVPTRELALQTHELFTKLNTFQWIVVGHLCGGESRKSEKDRIKKGINVLIGTPGRLLDHVLHTTAMKVDNVRCLVLDEADRLLDMGFRKDIVSLVEALDKSDNAGYDPMRLLRGENPAEDEVPELAEDAPPLKAPGSGRRQNLMLSATLSKEVSELADFTMKEHTYIDALDITSNAVADSYVIPDTVKQEFIMTHAKHRLFTLSALLLAKCRKAKACKVFVFMASTQMVEFHYELFRKCLLRMPLTRGCIKYGNVPLAEEDSDEDDEEMDEEVLNAELFKLHGNMDQKDRKKVFNGFRSCKKGILICTDVVARGIDVPTADCIIQYTGPQQDEDYLHRVGRTGRAGKAGNAIIFLTHEEQDYIDHLRKHRVFLTRRNAEEFLPELSDVMQQPNVEEAATALQRRYEAAVEKDPALGKLACFAYSTWSRFYNSYPQKMRVHFDFKKANLGHYVTSFALRQTPTAVARTVRGEVGKQQPPPRLNKKLANHSDNAELQNSTGKKATKGGSASGSIAEKKRPAPRSLGLVTSEFSSGLAPLRKKPKKS